MSRVKSQASVSDRLGKMRSVFADLRSSLSDAETSSSETLRAALIVCARAINLFVGNYSVSEHISDTYLVQLNSRMIRLTANRQDLTEAYALVCLILDTIDQDITRFEKSFSTEEDRSRFSSSRYVEDSDEDEDSESDASDVDSLADDSYCDAESN